MKMPERISPSMFAPCGMNCQVCYKHCDHKKPCAGCLNQDQGKPTHCRACKMKDCVQARGCSYCFECPEYPCKQIRNLEKSYQLTKKKELMGGQYASNETVTIVGLKLRAIENVRILGPVRSKSQVEVSATDAIRLGVKAPIRESGNIAGSAAVAVVGPKGVIYLNEGCIIAKRHIHMAPKDAMAAGVHDGDIVSVKADNERGTVFNHVQIRVDDSFTLEMHIDTDEANASKIATGDTVRIIC